MSNLRTIILSVMMLAGIMAALKNKIAELR